MSYIVVYQRADGSSGLEECESLDLAVVAAERLRNVDSVESPRILKTEEVKFDFRPYYRVEVSDDDATERPTPLSTPAPWSLSSSISPTPITSSGDSVSSAAIAESTPPPPAADVVPASAPVAETAPAVVPDPVPAEVEETVETEVSSAPIDPWATAEDSPIDYSLKSDTTDRSEAGVHAAVPEADAEQDLSSSARGLFSTNTLPDPPKGIDDVAALADDVSDAVPPRRGLFGR